MSRRCLPSLDVALAVLSTLFLGVVSAGGQAPAPAANAPTPDRAGGQWTTPRTAWGDPDLQGTWNNGTITPLERARGAGEKELLSKEEEEKSTRSPRTRAPERHRPTRPRTRAGLRPVLVGPRRSRSGAPR